MGPAALDHVPLSAPQLNNYLFAPTRQKAETYARFDNVEVLHKFTMVAYAADKKAII